MLNVMFCAKSYNLPQLTVAMSSFLHHNPNCRVHLFCDDLVDPKAVERLVEKLNIDASIRVMRHKHIELAALDYMICETELERVLFMGEDTLTQGSVADLGDIELGADSAMALVSSIWPFWNNDVRALIYREANFHLDEMREKVSTNYFSTSMFMLSLDGMRKRDKSSFCIWAAVMSDRGYDDVINHVIGPNSLMYMPTWMTAAVEVEIQDHLGIEKIVKYASAVKGLESGSVSKLVKTLGRGGEHGSRVPSNPDASVSRGCRARQRFAA
ncbi:hypothetical protein HSBAA_29430 [Vreelandella sulfidaeris]|uniref:Uncharacterized protein n=1 Tax=Vreelandella sulfidaeris TaxID=115553 RepID=A0A455U7Y1_9GAMM|nr:hypothetical protein HSBAA_29430 [Halomonas sulfidaeris]